jgi:hypothetical protein
MLKASHKIVSGLIVALGFLHIGFTFHDYDRLSLNAVWFAGSGVAIVLAGFLNIALIRGGGRDTVIRLLCFFTNLMFMLGFAAAAFMLPQPQVFFGLLLFACAAMISIFAVSESTQRNNL